MYLSIISLTFVRNLFLSFHWDVYCIHRDNLKKLTETGKSLYTYNVVVENFLRLWTLNLKRSTILHTASQYYILRKSVRSLSSCFLHTAQTGSPSELNRRCKVQVQVTLRLTVSQSISLGVEPRMGLMTRYVLLLKFTVLFFVGRPLWREDGSVFYICCWLLPAQSFSGPSPLN
jgi:hypothetical protein